MALAVLCRPRPSDDKAAFDVDEDDDIANVSRTVNPMAHSRAIDVAAEEEYKQGPEARKNSGIQWWRKGSYRPKIQDSKTWEEGGVAAEL